MICLLTFQLLTLLTGIQSSPSQNAAPTARTSAQLAALDALNAGTEEFKNGQYASAINDFKDA
jgi:hypothetical protein